MSTYIELQLACAKGAWRISLKQLTPDDYFKIKPLSILYVDIFSFIVERKTWTLLVTLFFARAYWIRNYWVKSICANCSLGIKIQVAWGIWHQILVIYLVCLHQVNHPMGQHLSSQFMIRKTVEHCWNSSGGEISCTLWEQTYIYIYCLGKFF